jgi:hypothetical protein
MLKTTEIRLKYEGGSSTWKYQESPQEDIKTHTETHTARSLVIFSVMTATVAITALILKFSK